MLFVDVRVILFYFKKLLSSTFEQLSSGSFDRLFLCCICWLKKISGYVLLESVTCEGVFLFSWLLQYVGFLTTQSSVSTFILSMWECFFCSSIKNSCSIQISNFSVSLFGILLSQRISLACVSFVYLVMIHPFISAILRHWI